MRMVTDQGVLVIHACAQPVVSCYCKGFLAVLDGLYTYGHCQKRRYATTPGLDACCAFLRRMMDSCFKWPWGPRPGPNKPPAFRCSYLPQRGSSNSILDVLSRWRMDVARWIRFAKILKCKCDLRWPQPILPFRFFGVCKWRTAFYAPFEVLKWWMDE
jgi:hypothetical protein